MGRKATINADLPPRLGRDHRTGALRYKRPDNGRSVYFGGIEEALVVEVATTLNAAFGITPPRGMRHLYRRQFMGFAWSGVTPEIAGVIAIKLPDIMPMQRGLAAQEEVRHSWAYDMPRPASFRHGLRAISTEEISNPESLPWVKAVFLAARKNAKARSIPFELDLQDIAHLIAASKGRCEVTGIALSNDRGGLETGRRMRRPWAPSLDRRDSAAGYIQGNCRIVCCAANYAMSQWGEEVLIEMAKAIARKRIKRMAPADRVAVG